MSGPKIKAFACPDCGRRFHKEQALKDHRQASHGVFETAPVVGRRPTLTEVDATCLDCGKVGKLVTGEVIYPHRRDLHAKHFYLCDCGAYCGCHPGSVIPLGHPCGPDTRKARSAAHEAFDPLWKGKGMSRSSAYAWLAAATGMKPSRCHIGMMSKDQAEMVVQAVYDYKVDQAVEALVRDGKATRVGDQVALTPEYHAELLRRQNETVQ